MVVLVQDGLGGGALAILVHLSDVLSLLVYGFGLSMVFWTSWSTPTPRYSRCCGVYFGLMDFPFYWSLGEGVVEGEHQSHIFVGGFVYCLLGCFYSSFPVYGFRMMLGYASYGAASAPSPPYCPIVVYLREE